MGVNNILCAKLRGNREMTTIFEGHLQYFCGLEENLHRLYPRKHSLIGTEAGHEMRCIS